MLGRRFLWGGGDDISKTSLVFWSNVCFPKRHGRLGIRCLDIMNKAMLSKLVWKMYADPNLLWVKILKTKYEYIYKVQPSMQCKMKLESSCFRSIRRVWEEAFEGIRKLVLDGQMTSFWGDEWIAEMDDPAKKYECFTYFLHVEV